MFASQPGASPGFQFPSIWFYFIRSSFNADKKKWKMYKDLSKYKIYWSVSINSNTILLLHNKKIGVSLVLRFFVVVFFFSLHNFFQLYRFHRVRLSYIVRTMNKSQLEFQVLYFHIGKSISGWGTLSKKLFHRMKKYFELEGALKDHWVQQMIFTWGKKLSHFNRWRIFPVEEMDMDTVSWDFLIIRSCNSKAFIISVAIWQ